MRILVDMNLSPDWCVTFAAEGWTGVHWSAVGDARAPDRVILEWAQTRGYILFTHDLDFSAILATSKLRTPSVIQIRTQDIMPNSAGAMVVATIREHQHHLQLGAIVSLDEGRARVRILPLGSRR